ncbi:MAG: hypothetical protein WCJ61_08150, partial [Paludibacter sp.]
MKKILLSIVFAAALMNVFGASRYWVGGASGNWSATSSWGSASGVADNASVPVAADDVYFDANSGANVIAYWIGVSPVLNSLNATSCNVTFAIVPAVTYTVAAGTITTASKTIALTNTTSIAASQFVYVISGYGAIPFSTTLASLAANTSVTLNTNFPFAGNPNNTATLAFVPTTATSITTNTMTLDNANVKAFVTVIVNGGIGNGTSTYDLSFLNSSTWTQCPLANGQSITLGSGGTFYMTGNSAANYFDGNTNGYISSNTTSAQTLYFNQSTIAANGGIGGPPVSAPNVPGWGAISPTKGIMTIANNVATTRITFGTNGTNLTQGVVLNPNVTLNITGNGSCTFNNQTNCQGIDASASGSKLIVTSQAPTFLGTQSSPWSTPVVGKIFKPSSVVNYLELNRTTYYFILPQAITVKNLVLTAGTLQSNSTNLLTMDNSATITRTAGTLSAVPTFGTSPSVVYSNTSAITTHNELPSSVVGLTLNGTQAVTLSAALTVSGFLKLTSGTLTNSTGNITFNSGGSTPVEITRTAGGFGGTGSQSAVFTSAVNLTYDNTTSTTSGFEVPLSATKLNNITINNAGGVVMSADRTINGTLTLTAGTLTIGTVGTPRNLTYKGSSIIRTSGNIDASIAGPVAGITFANTSALILPADLFTGNINNMTLTGAGGVTLGSPIFIYNTLTLTSGQISLGTNDLTIGGAGNITGGSATSYVVTDGAGKFNLPVSATATLIPIGTSTSSYDPATVTPTDATGFSAKVSATLSQTPASGSFYNPREWTLTPVAASSTVVSLTPSTDAATGIYSVIGTSDGASSYTNSYVTPVSGTYTGTFTSFLPFVTGKTDTPTSIQGAAKSTLNVYAQGSKMMINGLNTGDVVSIYKLNGQQVKSFIAN